MLTFSQRAHHSERSTGSSRLVFDVKRQSGACPGVGHSSAALRWNQCRWMCTDASQTRIAAVDGSVTPHRARLVQAQPSLFSRNQQSSILTLSIPFFFFFVKKPLILCGVKGHYIFKADNGSGLFRDDNLQLQIINRILLLGRNARIQII